MACNHVDFVAFDLPRQDHLRLSRHDPLPQLSGHVVSAVFIQPQLTSDLPIRQIQTHEVQAQQPDAQRLMMPRKNGVGQIIKTPTTAATQVTLPIRLSLIQASSCDLHRLAMRATYPLRPTQLPNRRKALRIVNQRQKSKFHPWHPVTNPRDCSHSSQPYARPTM